MELLPGTVGRERNIARRVFAGAETVGFTHKGVPSRMLVKVINRATEICQKAEEGQEIFAKIGAE